MRGRKPADPKIKALAAGTLEGDGAPARQLYPEAPAWITDPAAKAEWDRLIPDLIRRKKYLNLFEGELGRYCVAFGLYVGALGKMKGRGGVLAPVVKSSKKIDMLSMHWVVANRAHETMQKLAADLGLNAVAYQRIENLQLDLFGETPAARPSGDQGSNVTPFGGFRRA